MPYNIDGTSSVGVTTESVHNSIDSLSRASSFSYQGTNTPFEEIAEELGVSHVLEGSVRRDGDRVRIRAELIDADENRSLWSETFERELTSVFEIQDEIAARVAEALRTRIFRKLVLRTGNLTALREYYETLWPELFADEPTINPPNVDVVPDVAWILLSIGEEDRANAMLHTALDVFRANEWAPLIPSDLQITWVEVEMLALLGREDDAIDALRRLIENGWRFGWWLAERDPTLASIRDRPEFVAMLDQVKADLHTQLAGMPDYPLPSIPD